MQLGVCQDNPGLGGILNGELGLAVLHTVHGGHVGSQATARDSIRREAGVTDMSPSSGSMPGGLQDSVTQMHTLSSTSRTKATQATYRRVDEHP